MKPAVSSVPLNVAVQVVAEDDAGVLDEADTPRWVSAALSGAGHESGGNVTVRYVGEAESAELNATYRHKDGPTNVLAFPGEPAAPGGPDLDIEIGDLVVCLPVARREADEQDKTVHAHLAHLVVHGTLHLLGYDHGEDEEAERMERLEISVLDGLGIDDPYAS